MLTTASWSTCYHHTHFIVEETKAHRSLAAAKVKELVSGRAETVTRQAGSCKTAEQKIKN